MLSNFLKYKQKYPSMSLFFNWTVVDLQCVNFRCTAKWFSYTYIHAFFFFFRFFPLTGYYKILRNDRVILPLKTLKWETTKPCNGSPLLWESSANSLTRLMGQWCRLLPPLQPPSPPLPTTPLWCSRADLFIFLRLSRSLPMMPSPFSGAFILGPQISSRLSMNSEVWVGYASLWHPLQPLLIFITIV